MIRFSLLFLLIAFFGCENSAINEEWPVAGGSVERTQYSRLDEIDTSNVQMLEMSWSYSTNDAGDGTQIQCNPIIADGILYGTSPKLKLFALDAATGNELWVFDPALLFSEEEMGKNVNRGVTLWNDGGNSRIMYVVGSYLLSIDAATGKPDSLFGKGGKVDLRDGLDREASSLYVTATSPGVIYKDYLILGSRVSEAHPAAPGHIRAFNVRTGEREWIFHTIPHPGEIGFESWEDSLAYLRTGGANSWSGLSLDTERGWVFAATGSAAFDFYGGDRKGDNLFANSVLALNASSGELQWYYQTIHHDVWDRDLPAPPILTSLTVNGEKRDVAVQATKTGFIFILDRNTGEPVFPVSEVPVPQNSGLIGESLSPTQPVPEFPEPFMRQQLTLDRLKDMLSDSSWQDLEQRLSGYNYGEIFTPPSEEGTVFFPGLDGGAEWGGASLDPDSKILYINANEVPWIITNIRKAPDTDVLVAGESVYTSYCMSCHGPDLKGAGNYPALVSSTMNINSMYNLLATGKGMMPAFSFLSSEQKDAVLDYVINFKSGAVTDALPDSGAFNGYAITGYDKLQTIEGYPAIDPPWGTLNAIELSTGKIRWKTNLGQHPMVDSTMFKGITGSENYGGPVATSGGLLFIAATPDRKFRAFRKRDGKLLWETTLPFAGFATPAVYQADGKQFVVIACGGGKLDEPSGDRYIAFSIPD